MQPIKDVANRLTLTDWPVVLSAYVDPVQGQGQAGQESTVSGFYLVQVYNSWHCV